MLQNVSKKVSACYERAAVCRLNAERSSDDETKAAFLRIEASWLNLARRFETAERVDSFVRTAQDATGPLIFRCPHTGLEMNTGIETTYQTLAGAWAKLVTVRCEHCGGDHPIPVRDGYIRRSAADPR
jgi:hypothetical protein